MYSREGNTICHDLALMPERLNELLMLFESEDKALFNLLLMPNWKGLTPIDIALDHQSPKCLELMLTRLLALPDCYSMRVLSRRIVDLLEMNLASFHSLLTAAVFKSPQMATIHTLQLKEETELFIDVHSTCLIEKASSQHNLGSLLTDLNSKKMSTIMLHWKKQGRNILLSTQTKLNLQAWL